MSRGIIDSGARAFSFTSGVLAAIVVVPLLVCSGLCGGCVYLGSVLPKPPPPAQASPQEKPASNP